MPHHEDPVATYQAWCNAIMNTEEPNSIINQLGNLYWVIEVYRAQIRSWGHGKTEEAAIPPLFSDYFLKTLALFSKCIELLPRSREW